MVTVIGDRKISSVRSALLSEEHIFRGESLQGSGLTPKCENPVCDHLSKGLNRPHWLSAQAPGCSLSRKGSTEYTEGTDTLFHLSSKMRPVTAIAGPDVEAALVWVILF